MFRNQYDYDITIWSPQGKLHQIEYAMEAVKQGSAVVGVRSKDCAVLVALKRASEELASYQKKIIRVDDHIGIAIAGLTSDARVMSNFMRVEAMRSKMIFKRPIPLQRIVGAVGDKAQKNTMGYGGRPYGVGLLVIGYDEKGPHLYEISPSGNTLDYYGISIGSRSQSAKTYLERNFETFEGCDIDQLIVHALRALNDTLQAEKELSVDNVSIAVVGKDIKFTQTSEEDISRYLNMIKQEE